MTQPLLLTVKEAAALTGLSETTLRTMIRDGEIASFAGRGRGDGLRKLLRIERAEIDRWIERNRTPATSP